MNNYVPFPSSYSFIVPGSFVNGMHTVFRLLAGIFTSWFMVTSDVIFRFGFTSPVRACYMFCFCLFFFLFCLVSVISFYHFSFPGSECMYSFYILLVVTLEVITCIVYFSKSKINKYFYPPSEWHSDLRTLFTLFTSLLMINYCCLAFYCFLKK